MYKLLAYHRIEKKYLGHEKIVSSTVQFPAEREFREEAMFAGGSFWRVEASFHCVEGVLKTATGYYGGTRKKPTGREVHNVSNVNTGHTETVKVVYDKRIVSFRTLCELFSNTHDPTDREFLVPLAKQFGLNTHLRSAIFYTNEEQRRDAIESKIRQQMKLNRRIVTVILPGYSSEFFLAETRHQKHYLQTYHVWLCECLGLRSREHFADSLTACKLNGFLSGGDVQRNKEKLRSFIDGRDISENTKEILLRILQS